MCAINKTNTWLSSATKVTVDRNNTSLKESSFIYYECSKEWKIFVVDKLSNELVSVREVAWANEYLPMVIDEREERSE